MFKSEKRIDEVLTQYQSLVVSFACAIISNPDYPFRTEDKADYLNEDHSGYHPGWKYDVVMLEASRYAAAFMAID